MIIEYLTKSLIYFIIIAATAVILKHTHPNTKGSGSKISVVCKWAVLCLVPFLRAIVVFIFIVLILIPEETLDKVNEKKN